MQVDRSKFLGGSDIAAILGISPWKTAVDLWLDKTEPKAEGSDNAATRRGSRLEPYVLDMVRQEYGLHIAARNQRYVDPHVDYFAAEIDAEAETPDTAWRQNIEIKTVHPFKAGEWGQSSTDELPLHYVAQTQWGLGITGRRICRVFALIGDDLRPFVVERDDETIEAMRARARDFWQTFVVPRVRPPIELDDPRALSTLRRLYPGTDGSTIDASDQACHWRAVLHDAERKRDLYQGIVDGARAHLLDSMGAAAVLRFTDGKEFRRKLTKRAGYTVEPTSYMDFRLVNTKEKTA